MWAIAKSGVKFRTHRRRAGAVIQNWQQPATGAMGDTKNRSAASDGPRPPHYWAPKAVATETETEACEPVAARDEAA